MQMLSDTPILIYVQLNGVKSKLSVSSGSRERICE